MNDLESLVRETLTDDRRRVDAPVHTTEWVRREVTRQRRRTAAVAGALTATLVAAGAMVAVPLLNDTEASYVAGRPDAASGLLHWKPVGTLAAEADTIASAVTAWETGTADEPAGDVHAIAAEQWDDSDTVVVLQARTDSGAPTIAMLTRPAEDAATWLLRGTAALPAASEVEALLLPARDNSVDAGPRELGGAGAASLILSPEWRTHPWRARSLSLGWQQFSASAGFGDEPRWEPLDHVSGYGWWAPLLMDSDTKRPPTTVVLDHERRGYAEVAPVLDLGATGNLAALTPGDVTLGLLPRRGANPDTIALVSELADRLGITGPIEATVLTSGSGAVSFGRPLPSTDVFFAQLTAAGAAPILVAYAATEGRIDCLSTRTLPQGGVQSLPFVGMACPTPVGGGERRDIQGHELWADSFSSRPSGQKRELTYTVTLVRERGQSSRETLAGGIALRQYDRATEPVQRYVFRAFSENGRKVASWVWPASEVTG